jgi:hypothetical protein
MSQIVYARKSRKDLTVLYLIELWLSLASKLNRRDVSALNLRLLTIWESNSVLLSDSRLKYEPPLSLTVCLLSNIMPKETLQRLKSSRSH